MDDDAGGVAEEGREGSMRVRVRVRVRAALLGNTNAIHAQTTAERHEEFPQFEAPRLSQEAQVLGFT